MAITRDGLKSLIKSVSEREQFQALHWEGGFDDYLDVVAKDPRVARNAFQRLYDLIVSFGVKETSDGKDTVKNFAFPNQIGMLATLPFLKDAWVTDGPSNGALGYHGVN